LCVVRDNHLVVKLRRAGEGPKKEVRRK
jgi:hypothetical protein